MRNSTLLKWAQNSTYNKNQATKTGGTGSNWIHPPDTLQKGHIAYLVKYLGSTEVDQPKGIEVVKDAICKLKFNQQIKKSEGTKTPKVELTISIDGVAIQEPKTKTVLKRIMQQYPLHRISYCADDKGEKKFFSFIAKEEDAERHTCFVFVSEKLAEEITLTIGQAFDLAYKRFLETSGKDLEIQRRAIVLQQKIKRLEHENNVYRQRLQAIASIKGSDDISSYLTQEDIPDILHIPDSSITLSAATTKHSISRVNGSAGKLFINSSADTNGNDSNEAQQPPPVPPRNFQKSFDHNFIGGESSPHQTLSTKMKSKSEGLFIDEFDEDDFNPRAIGDSSNGMTYHLSNNYSSDGQMTAGTIFTQPNVMIAPPLLAPPPKTKDSRRRNGTKEDLFGSIPFKPTTNFLNDDLNDPFEMGEFRASAVCSSPTHQDLENAIGLLDKRLSEMKDGFSRGLSIGTDDFSLESLDPFRN